MENAEEQSESPEPVSGCPCNRPAKVDFDREKWLAEKAFRECELEIEEEKLKVSAEEIGLKREELNRARWTNPLVLAILAATVAAVGNTVVSVLNGKFNRDIEAQKSEQTRILEMIKTGDNPDKAADNLKFLLDAGLIAEPELTEKVKNFLAKRQPGEGPTLPDPTPRLNLNLGSGSQATTAVQAGRAIGMLTVRPRDGAETKCSAFLISNDIIATARSCVPASNLPSTFAVRSDDGGEAYQVIQTMTPATAPDITLLRVIGQPGRKYGFLKLASTPAKPTQKVTLTEISISEAGSFFVEEAQGCAIVSIEPSKLTLRCEGKTSDTKSLRVALWAGAPVLNENETEVIGIQSAADLKSGDFFAAPVDSLSREPILHR